MKLKGALIGPSPAAFAALKVTECGPDAMAGIGAVQSNWLGAGNATQDAVNVMPELELSM